jgi:hypothetical protein
MVIIKTIHFVNNSIGGISASGNPVCQGYAEIIAIKEKAMIFRQFLYHSSGCAAYVFG